MPTKIRLQRHGRKKRPFYHIVIADSRAPRDGKFIQKIGTYNPLTVPATINLDREEAFKWMMSGAQPTDTVRAILKFKGLYFRKHLQRGVAKGAMTQEAADKLYEEWIAAKDAKIEKRKEDTQAKMEVRRAQIFGVAPVKPVVEETPATEEAPAAEETTTDGEEA